MNQENNVISSEFPWVAFRVRQENYCITSEYVLQMVIQEECTPMPQAPAFVLGILNVRGEIYPVVDLRTLLGMGTLRAEIEAFGVMKTKHMEWVQTLEKSVQTNTPFTLSKDPHQCTFGLWYDSFTPTSSAMRLILEEIKEPHAKMHYQAGVIDTCREKGDEAGIRAAYGLAEELCHKKIVPLLEELIEAYKAASKGMIMLLQKGEAKVGLLVDSITSIENFLDGHMDNMSLKIEKNNYIKSIIVSGDGTIYLEIDFDALANITKSMV